MQTNTILNVAGAVVLLAMVFTVTSNPGSAGVIRALGDAFAGSIRAATGR